MLEPYAIIIIVCILPISIIHASKTTGNFKTRFLLSGLFYCFHPNETSFLTITFK